jgi:hypothetical protein
MIIYRIPTRLFLILIKLIKIIRKSRSELILENLALRQQLATYQTKIISKLKNLDRSFWIALKQSWSQWANHLTIVSIKGDRQIILDLISQVVYSSNLTNFRY